MIAGSFKFGTVVGVSAVNLIRALDDDTADEKANSAVLGSIWKNIGTQLPGKIIDSHKQILTRLIDRLTFQKGKPFSIEVNQLTRIRFVIAFSFTLETFLNRLLDLGQTFEDHSTP